MNKCPRCSSVDVVTRNRPYTTAHFDCRACGYKWRMVRGSVKTVDSSGYEIEKHR